MTSDFSYTYTYHLKSKIEEVLLISAGTSHRLEGWNVPSSGRNEPTSGWMLAETKELNALLREQMEEQKKQHQEQMTHLLALLEKKWT
jgi:predicted RNA-binding protein with PIN domain